jgi:ketosteroid isomerase-like protein
MTRWDRAAWLEGITSRQGTQAPRPAAKAGGSPQTWTRRQAAQREAAGAQRAVRHRYGHRVSIANLQLIERFYGAFAQRNGDEMAACYAPDATFSDPVFQNLRGSEPGAMWRMLTSRGADLTVELLEHAAEDNRGTARWKATYTFTQTGRPVVNDVRATFRFVDGRIADHHDDFSFYRWAQQALGPVGLLLGWTPIVRSSVRHKARAGLDEFIAGKG